MYSAPKSKKYKKILSTISVVTATAVLTIVMYYTQQLGNYFEASILTEQEEQLIDFDGAVYPIKTVPNWVKWTGDVHTDNISTVPSNLLISIPSFDRSLLNAQVTDASDSQYTEVKNAQLTYTVLWTGNYKLDHTENTGSHPGVDIRTPIGTPVYSIANGIVIATEEKSSGFGKYIVVKHPNTPSGVIYSNYAHLSSIEVNVGDVVNKDQKIGEVGNTGTATTPHIHFQIDNDEAPWHPYWPFSFSEMNAQGLSFFEAVNAGLGKENVKKYTINPMDWINDNKDESIQSSNNTNSGNSNTENNNSNEDITNNDSNNSNTNNQNTDSSDTINTGNTNENNQDETHVESDILQKFEITISQKECNITQSNTIEVTAKNANGTTISKYTPSNQFSLDIEGSGDITLLETLQFIGGKAQSRFTCDKHGDVTIAILDAGVSAQKTVSVLETQNASEAQLFGFEIAATTQIIPGESAQIRVIAKDRKGNVIKDYRPSTPISIVLWGEGETNKSTLSSIDFTNGEAIFYFENDKEGITNVTVGNAQVTLDVNRNAKKVSHFEIKHDGTFETNKTETIEIIALDTNDEPTNVFQFSGEIELKTLSGSGIFEPEKLTQVDFIRGKAKVKFSPQSTKNTIISASFNDIKSESPTLAFAHNIDKPQPEFKDLDTTHKNYQAISHLYGENVLNGYPDGTFQPEKTVNRVEAIKILLLSNGITTESEANSLPFSDTNTNEWYGPYLETAYSQGFVNGYPDGKFRPSQTVNRVEFLKMALELKGISSENISGSLYGDIQRNAWYAPYAIYTKEKNLLETSNNQLEPTKGMSRAEVAEMIYRLTVIEKTQASVYTPDLSI